MNKIDFFLFDFEATFLKNGIEEYIQSSLSKFIRRIDYKNPSD